MATAIEDTPASPRYLLRADVEVPAVPDPPKPWETAPFWTTILTYVFAGVALIFHHDLSSLTAPLATVAAGIATAGYAVYAAWQKHSHTQLQLQHVGYVSTSLQDSQTAAIQRAFNSVSADIDELHSSLPQPRARKKAVKKTATARPSTPPVRRARRPNAV